MRWQLTTPIASRHLLHRLLKLRRSLHAHIHVLRPTVDIDRAHILLLHRLSTYIPLAAHHHHVTLPPLQRQKAQRSTKPN